MKPVVSTLSKDHHPAAGRLNRVCSCFLHTVHAVPSATPFSLSPFALQCTNMLPFPFPSLFAGVVMSDDWPEERRWPTWSFPPFLPPEEEKGEEGGKNAPFSSSFPFSSSSFSATVVPTSFMAGWTFTFLILRQWRVERQKKTLKKGEAPLSGNNFRHITGRRKKNSFLFLRILFFVCDFWPPCVVGGFEREHRILFFCKAK